MVTNVRERGRRGTKRFSVTLDRADYDELVALAKQQKPRLTLQYVVNYALQRFLREARTSKVQLGNPLGKGDDGQAA